MPALERRHRTLATTRVGMSTAPAFTSCAQPRGSTRDMQAHTQNQSTAVCVGCCVLGRAIDPPLMTDCAGRHLLVTTGSVRRLA